MKKVNPFAKKGAAKPAAKKGAKPNPFAKMGKAAKPAKKCK